MMMMMTTPDSTAETPGGNNDTNETLTAQKDEISLFAKERNISSQGNPPKVGSVVLYGVAIVSLTIDGRERLCLAQISNTLLKTFTYNEIHNRRVALGITCVQCTPVQLELLRRAGAMPVSSRRCGMITRREAERLCNSFLGDNSPPSLPESFTFDVQHRCAWGCRGLFFPSRYNSSRAKCIKCCHCAGFFSPNKFIFHSHHAPGAIYVQPDAANFNSWRRHISLTDDAGEHVLHAWEDVKAMFNGGSRKRSFQQDTIGCVAGQNRTKTAGPPTKAAKSQKSSKTAGASDGAGNKSSSTAGCRVPAPLNLAIRPNNILAPDSVTGSSISAEIPSASDNEPALTSSHGLHPLKENFGEASSYSFPECLWPPMTAARWPEMSSLAALTSNHHLWSLPSRSAASSSVAGSFGDVHSLPPQSVPTAQPHLSLPPSATASHLLNPAAFIDYPSLYSLDAVSAAAALGGVQHLFRPSIVEAMTSGRSPAALQGLRPPWLAALDKHLLISSSVITNRKSEAGVCPSVDKFPSTRSHE